MLWCVAAWAADVGTWEGVLVQAALHEESKVGGRIWFDAHARRDGGKFVGILRPGLGLDLGRGFTIWGGYAWIPSVADGDPLKSEHRIWEQVTWNASSERFGGGLRGRLEQRFAAGTEGVGLRFRGFGRAQVNLPGSLALVAWDEAFVEVNDSGFLPPGFDQNRLFVGPAWRAGALRAEVGLLEQHFVRAGTWTAVTAFATNLFFTL